MKTKRSNTSTHSIITFRQPCVDDGAQLHALIAACPPLDLNSVYAYLLQAHYFSDTCIVAEHQGLLAGFVSGFIVPAQADTLFIWQVAVHPEYRGIGLGARMLDALLQCQQARGVRFIETTVSPDNLASRALFHALARRHQTELSEFPLFEKSMFGQHAHQDEPVLRIGPMDRSVQNSMTDGAEKQSRARILPDTTTIAARLSDELTLSDIN